MIKQIKRKHLGFKVKRTPSVGEHRFNVFIIQQCIKCSDAGDELSAMPVGVQYQSGLVVAMYQGQRIRSNVSAAMYQAGNSLGRA